MNSERHVMTTSKKLQKVYCFFFPPNEVDLPRRADLVEEPFAPFSLAVPEA